MSAPETERHGRIRVARMIRPQPERVAPCP